MIELLVLHGALGSAAQMQAIAEKATLTDCNISYLEFEGHGTTPLTESGFGMRAFVQQLYRRLQQYSTPPLVVGYSMGGYVALLAAAEYPGLMQGICTLGTKFQWSASIAERESRMLDTETLQAKVPAFATMLEQRHTAIGWKNVCRNTEQILRGLGRNPLLTNEVLSAIQEPVVIAVGDRDETVTVEETAQAASQIRTSALCVLPATRHPIEKISVDSWSFLLRQSLQFIQKPPLKK